MLRISLVKQANTRHKCSGSDEEQWVMPLLDKHYRKLTTGFDAMWEGDMALE